MGEAASRAGAANASGVKNGRAALARVAHWHSTRLASAPAKNSSDWSANNVARRMPRGVRPGMKIKTYQPTNVAIRLATKVSFRLIAYSLHRAQEE